MQDQSCANVPYMANTAIHPSVQSFFLTARGDQWVSTFPSVPAPNAYLVSLAGFACSLLNSVLPGAAQYQPEPADSYPGYSCRVTVTPLGFSVSTACADSSQRGGDMRQKPRVLHPPKQLLQCVKLAWNSLFSRWEVYKMNFNADPTIPPAFLRAQISVLMV